MNYQIENPTLIRKLLWLDCILGALTAAIGLVFRNELVDLLGLPYLFIFWVAIINALYASVSLRLATMGQVSIPLLRSLVVANWVWMDISVVLLYFHFMDATLLGQTLLVLQIIIVGGLAYMEGYQIKKVTA
ncbi:MAG: hypothetical protein ABJF11_04210 [Reichenbachiella sp.]|uniref:hypothetical protein n=1 Tax=Reichenbachiella sp. TaxID=2184521 RepID=UPI003263B42D